MPVCRHCKSPNRWNPCWYRITIGKGTDPSGGDPPCLTDIYNEEQEARDRKSWPSYSGVAILLILILIIIVGWRLS